MDSFRQQACSIAHLCQYLSTAPLAEHCSYHWLFQISIKSRFAGQKQEGKNGLASRSQCEKFSILVIAREMFGCNGVIRLKSPRRITRWVLFGRVFQTPSSPT